MYCPPSFIGCTSFLSCSLIVSILQYRQNAGPVLLKLFLSKKVALGSAFVGKVTSHWIPAFAGMTRSKAAGHPVAARCFSVIPAHAGIQSIITKRKKVCYKISYKSSHFGFIDSMRLIFHFLFHFFNAFSLASATSISSVHS